MDDDEGTFNWECSSGTCSDKVGTDRTETMVRVLYKVMGKLCCFCG